MTLLAALPPTKPLEAPEPESYTVHVPEGLAALDLDVIKLSAQFTARNGKAFLTGLASREHANPQFNFLKPTHSLFAFFTALCDAYSKVLMPPKEMVARLEGDAADRAAILERALRRLEWERVQEKEARDKANAEEAEREAMMVRACVVCAVCVCVGGVGRCARAVAGACWTCCKEAPRRCHALRLLTGIPPSLLPSCPPSVDRLARLCGGRHD